MKVYKYYYIGDKYGVIIDHTKEDKDIDYYKDKYQLYAVSTDKKVAKNFECSRNMKKFLKTTVHMDKEEYVDWINKKGRESLVISEEIIYTRRPNHPCTIMSVKVPMTYSEYLFVTEFDLSMYLDGLEGWTTSPPAYIFDKEVENTLRTLGYPEIRELYLAAGDDKKVDVDDYMPNLEIDQLSILTDYFAGTFTNEDKPKKHKKKHKK